MDNIDFNTPPDDETRSLVTEYLKRAGAACAQGDAMLGMHLYLAAFEESSSKEEEPSAEALSGLRQAWTLACSMKERSLAEYIFERLEPFLSSGELAHFTDQLQNLALDRLEEFGLTREELEDMAEMITHDVLGLDTRVVKVEHILERPVNLPGKTDSAAPVVDKTADADAQPAASGDVIEVPGIVAGEGDTAAASGALASGAPRDEAAQANSSDAAGGMNPLAFLAKAARDSGIRVSEVSEVLNYRTVVGYDRVVSTMRDMGIGLQDDEAFQELVGLLNTRHGLDRMPALDTLLFRSPAREDANRFVMATLGELGLPAVRMHMEENLQGMPLLCVTAQADDAAKLGSPRNAFEGGGVLVLEDIDLWGAPLSDMNEEAGSFLMMQLSRGAREAINLVRSAVENPEVYVLATAATTTDVDGFFLDMLEPLSFVDIDFPTPEERVDIWMDIAREHPSLRSINRADLVRLSANMPRFDMYMAAREAVEEAYKHGLMARHYQPVTRDNLFDKLAAYQPLESREYHELEEAVVRDFRADLANLDDLLKGE